MVNLQVFGYQRVLLLNVKHLLIFYFSIQWVVYSKSFPWVNGHHKGVGGIHQLLRQTLMF